MQDIVGIPIDSNLFSVLILTITTALILTGFREIEEHRSILKKTFFYGMVPTYLPLLVLNIVVLLIPSSPSIIIETQFLFFVLFIFISIIYALEILMTIPIKRLKVFQK